MTTYQVIWEIELDASTPLEAAREALRIQLDPDSIATVFKVRAPFKRAVTVDLQLEADLRIIRKTGGSTAGLPRAARSNSA